MKQESLEVSSRPRCVRTARLFDEASQLVTADTALSPEHWFIYIELDPSAYSLLKGACPDINVRVDRIAFEGLSCLKIVHSLPEWEHRLIVPLIGATMRRYLSALMDLYQPLTLWFSCEGATAPAAHHVRLAALIEPFLELHRDDISGEYEQLTVEAIALLALRPSERTDSQSSRSSVRIESSLLQVPEFLGQPTKD